MNYKEAMEYIHGIMRFGSKLGLERMRELMHRLGDPQKQTRFVHVAGTNGKGSTVTMLSEILQSAGYRVGKYVSPYVFDFRERIAVNGEMISENALCDLTERISFVCGQMENDGWDAVTEFEFITAMAFCYYVQEKCDVVVLEVGLGGRYDATNVIDAPLVSVITTLALDHTAILGDTIEKIAFEKCGIIKPPSPAVMYPIQLPGADRTVREECEKGNCPLFVADIEKLEILQCDLGGNRFVYKGREYEQNLLGEYQIYNAINVLETVEALRREGYDISDTAVCHGLKSCHMPARFDKVSDKPLIILDAGHNPQGIDALAALMDKMQGRSTRIVFAVMADKEYLYAIEKLSQRAKSFYGVTLSDFPRALPAEQIAEIASRYCKDACAFSAVPQALDAALQDIGEDCLLVCGSFYVMERAMQDLKNRGIL